MPADRQTVGDDDAAARAQLAGECRINRYRSLPGACSLESEDGEKLPTACITDALSEMVIPDHAGNPQVLMIDRVVGLDQGERRLVVKVLPLAAHFLLRLDQQMHGFPSSVAAPLAT
jgi:hypothetical protein